MTADHTPERLSARELDVIIEAAHPSRPDREDLTRHHVERILAAHLADVEARLAAVEALADEWERLADGADRGSFAKRERWTGALRARATEVRAALHPDPSEVARDE